MPKQRYVDARVVHDSPRHLRARGIARHVVVYHYRSYWYTTLVWRLSVKILRAIAPALVVCAAAFQTAFGQEGSVSGTVLAAGSSRPLAGARVTVTGQADRGAISNVYGRFRILGLSGTSVALVARHIGDT